jgi:hypothetical protein
MYSGFKTIGEYIESLSKDNDYALNIISHYTKNVDPTVRLANVINLLPKSKQEFILKMILDEKTGNVKNKEVEIISYTSVNLNESNDSVGGKKVFQCFLKVITALGQKEISQNFDICPKEFLFYFETDLLPVDDVKSVMGRYHYFDFKINKIDYTFNVCNIYYGVKVDGKFEYGIRTESDFVLFGGFDVTPSVLKYFLLLTSPSSKNLRKQLSVLNLEQIILLGKIKQSMINFNAGTFQKRLKPVISDNIISFGFMDQQIDPNEIENVKSNLKSFLIPFKWSDKVQVSVSTTGNHLYLNIKVK